jgi:hypothetical protein
VSNFDVFISHSSYDKEFVRRLRTDLEIYGCKVWLDENYLHAGGRLSVEIEDAIRSSRYLLAVHSRHSSSSPWCEQECTYAQLNGVPVVPLVLDAVAGAELGDMLYANFAETDDQHKYHRAFHDVLTAIGIRGRSGRDLVIYSSRVSVGWRDSSWDARCTERCLDTVDGITCFRAELKPFGGAAFVFRSGINTAPFSALEFSIRGGGEASQKIKVFFNDRIGNGIQNSVPLPPLTKEWQDIRIPLTELGVENTIIFKVNWSHTHGALAESIYLANIRLTL